MKLTNFISILLVLLAACGLLIVLCSPKSGRADFEVIFGSFVLFMAGGLFILINKYGK